MKKILLLTAEKDAAEREKLAEAARRILKDDGCFDMIRDSREVTYDRLKEYSSCVSLDEKWSREAGVESGAALISYVAGGGGLLAVHSGISLNEKYSLPHLTGAVKSGRNGKKLRVFRRHGSTDHVIMDGIDTFETESAPYSWGFESQMPGPRYFSPMTPMILKRSILFEYEHNKNSELAGWTCEYCLGRVVCIDAISDFEELKNEQIVKILRRSIEWVSEEREGLLI